MMPDKSLNARYIAPALDTGIKILRLFSSRRTGMTLSEIARAVEINRSSAFRLLYTLEAQGLVKRDKEGTHFRLNLGVLDLGFSLLNSLDIVDLARPTLEALRDTTQGASHLAVREGQEIIYLCRMASRRRLTSNVTVGTRLPAHATSLGRVLLMELPKREIEALYVGREMARYSEATPTQVDDLLGLLDEDRRRGYVLSRGNYEANVASIAAPLRDHFGDIVAAISIVDHVSIVDNTDDNQRLVKAVIEAAHEISSWIGYQNSEDPEEQQRQDERSPLRSANVQ